MSVSQYQLYINVKIIYYIHIMYNTLWHRLVSWHYIVWYTTKDMFVDSWIRGFRITCIRKITEVKKYFIGIFNSWIVLRTNYTK